MPHGDNSQLTAAAPHSTPLHPQPGVPLLCTINLVPRPLPHKTTARTPGAR
jgi:hypothetical protein